MSKQRQIKWNYRNSVDRLHAAAVNWLQKQGGDALISGGPFVISGMPGDTSESFYVAIKMLGRRPVKRDQPAIKKD